MACETVQVPGGGVARVCSRGGRRPAPCSVCRTPHVALCDYPKPRRGRPGATCDAKLCDAHRWSPAPDVDYCPEHRARHEADPPLILPTASTVAPQAEGRRELDKYYTPPWMIRAFLRLFPQVRGRALFDPMCGDSRMASMLSGRFERVVRNDLDPGVEAEHHLDASAPELWEQLARELGPIDWVVTNPSFTVGGQAAWHALQAARSVALLLRCTFGEPCGASPRFPRNGRRWMLRRPPTAVVMMPRDSFSGDGDTDSAPTWWYIWSPDVAGIYVVDESYGANQLSLDLGGTP